MNIISQWRNRETEREKYTERGSEDGQHSEKSVSFPTVFLSHRVFLSFSLLPSQFLFFSPDDLSHSKFIVFICVCHADIFHLSSLLLFLSSLIGHCRNLLRSLQENGPMIVCVCVTSEDDVKQSFYENGVTVRVCDMNQKA